MADEGLTPVETEGELEEEKVFHSKKLGSFTFRLPYSMDEILVLRRRAQIMGIAENLAGPELLAISHAQAMFEVYNVHAPHKFDVSRMRTWAPFLTLMTEVGNWHQDFFRQVGDQEE